MVLRIAGELGPAQGVRIVQLDVLGYSDAGAIVGQAQQEVSKRVVGGDRWWCCWSCFPGT